MDRFASLKAAVEGADLVDAHAHAIVAADSAIPFLSCFSEASGDALLHAVHTVCFKRGLKEIAELYGTNASLEAVQEYRSRSGVESITAKCLKAAGVSAVLIDDGIELDKKFDIDWHKALSPFVGRILGIEAVAQKIFDAGAPGGTTWTLDSFTELFVKTLKSHTNEILAFKSTCAYCSGLEINTNVLKGDAEEGLNEVLQAGKPVRIANKNFIDYIFVRALEVARDLDLPVQIYTGFGDKDLDLRLANPLHLRGLLEDSRFSKSRIVLLHASYPFSKEASYLASVYSQVYLDFGLAVPKLSYHGMLTSIKEILALAPINKVMFSSDAIAFPESFYLGAKKAREIVFSVLRDAYIDGDLSISEALQAARDIFSENARELYKIKGADTSDSDIISSPSSLVLSTDAPVRNDAFVRIYWIDTSGQHRCRAVSQQRFHDFIGKKGITLACATMAMSSFTDGPAEGSNLSGVGDVKLVPDLSTRTTIPWAKDQEMVLGDMHLVPGTPWAYCPRETLRRAARVLKDEFNLEMNAGFENEFYLLKSVVVNGEEKWLPLNASSTSYCSSNGFDIGFPILQEIAASLESMNIGVEQIHAESGNGQFEVVLRYTTCEKSADNVVFAREVVRSVARKHGLLATFVPKYSLTDIGSGSHVHISLAENGENVFMGTKGTRYGISKIGEVFMAGVLEHLPAILAFTAPLPNSYDRIQPNTWSGAYQCWGPDNREAPIRATCPPGTEDGLINNFEIKAFDGCANPYLGLVAILAAGIDGLRKLSPLPDPVGVNPDAVKATLKRLPGSLTESVAALEKDAVMKEFFGEELFIAAAAVKKAEAKYYSENKDAYKNLIHRY